MNEETENKKTEEEDSTPLCLALKTFIYIVADNADSKTFCGLFFPCTF
ncbi:MAG: hypothetical protein JWP12_1883 [Bacteroidetes bacterium]|nr:hypothetical protein [Bacteroidota bacterium]